VWKKHDHAGFTKKGLPGHFQLLVGIGECNYMIQEKGLDVDVDVVCEKRYRNDGPRMKRIRPAPMGARSGTAPHLHMESFWRKRRAETSRRWLS